MLAMVKNGGLGMHSKLGSCISYVRSLRPFLHKMRNCALDVIRNLSLCNGKLYLAQFYFLHFQLELGLEAKPDFFLICWYAVTNVGGDMISLLPQQLQKLCDANFLLST